MKAIKISNSKKSTVSILGLLLLFLFTSTTINAQEIEVKGIVKGQTIEKTEVLKGANIYLKDTKEATSSDKNGEFTFPKKLKKGDVLIISYLGYIKKRVTIKENSTYLKITLLEDDNEMLGALNSKKRFKSKRPKN